MSTYCKYCDRVIPIEDRSIARDDAGNVIWVGCHDCYEDRIKRTDNNVAGTE
jgi:RNase P subunit RPR2